VDEFNVRFRPQDITVRIPRGTDLLSAAIKGGIVLAAACGGEGLCGKCRVIVSNGTVKTDMTRLISAVDRDRGVVLACQTMVEGDLEVEIPWESLGHHETVSHVAEDFTKGIALKREGIFPFSPLVRKVYLELPVPSGDDNVSDLERIEREAREKKGLDIKRSRLSNVKHIGSLIREADYKITVLAGYRDDSLEVVSVEPGGDSGANYGFAFDIGTTTVVGQLVDLNSKAILGTRIAFNKQASYGADVITRIIYASNPAGLEELSMAVLDNINDMIRDMCQAYDIGVSDVNAATLAGNMTMMHLLLKVDPSNIRKAPYIPATTVFETIGAAEADIEINPKGLAAFFPGVTTYVGGDIVSGVLACGLSEDADISLLIDIGTNGEIVLGNRDWMIGSAASAGPAFEGSGLSCGMKAVKGAIQRASIDEMLDVTIGTIAEEKPKGICGSAYIDLLCQMLKRGIIGKDGRINRNLKNWRVRKGEANYEFVIVPKDMSATGRDIVIQDDDIENLKRSKGAIYSAIIALLNKVEKKVSDLKRIYIAGGFGNYLNIENSIFIGLLPDAERSVYEFIGNSSLAGARMGLLSHEAFLKAHDISKNITYIDLSSEPNYMDEYIASLFFPHTDIGRFPSVRL